MKLLPALLWVINKRFFKWCSNLLCLMKRIYKTWNSISIAYKTYRFQLTNLYKWNKDDFPQILFMLCLEINCNNKYLWSMNVYNAQWSSKQDCAQLSYGTYSNCLIYGLYTAIVCCRSGENWGKDFNTYFNNTRWFPLTKR